MERQTTAWLVPVLLALGVAGALWFYSMRVEEPATPLQLPRSPEVAAPQPAPQPVQPLPMPGAAIDEQTELVPLPPLDQSDEYFKLALADVFGPTIEGMLASSGVIERIVATVDNLPRSQVAERIRPLDGPVGPFVTDGQEDVGEYFINSSNFDRYGMLVNLAAGADPESVAEVYRRFYPLFQKSYVDLGYPDGYFNDRLIEVIDHLLETPDIGDSVMLVRPHVLYKFADEDLESRSAGQKLMLRMGREHRNRVKQALRQFRDIAMRL